MNCESRAARIPTSGLAAIAAIALVSGIAVAEEPQPPRLTFAFEVQAQVAEPTIVGDLPGGLQRRIIEILGGTVSGPGIAGRVLPFRGTPTFETAAPELEWLMKSVFVATGERHPRGVIIRFWRVH